MNNEDQENEALKRPTILTAPACLTVPGFGFLIALNPDWCFEEINKGDDSSQTRRRPVRPFQEFLTVVGRESFYHPPKHETFDSGLLSVFHVAFLVRLGGNCGQGSSCRRESESP